MGFYYFMFGLVSLLFIGWLLTEIFWGIQWVIERLFDYDICELVEAVVDFVKKVWKKFVTSGSDFFDRHPKLCFYPLPKWLCVLIGAPLSVAISEFCPWMYWVILAGIVIALCGAGK